MITLETKTKLCYGDSLQQLISDMFEAESDRANKLSNKTGCSHSNKPDGVTEAYTCIHLSMDEFCDSLAFAVDYVLKKTNQFDCQVLSFIDVGCGVGQKVYMANRLFELKSFGLELRHEHVLIARELLEKYLGRHSRNSYDNSTFNLERIIEANAITFDRFSEFDFIYFYCPSPDVMVEYCLEQAIAKNAKVGAVVIGFLSQYFENRRSSKSEISQEITENEWKSLGWIKIGNHCWERVSLTA